LGRIRLSRDEDEAGTSVDRQRESIETWAKLHGHSVIGWAIDTGVSGSVDPFDTPELGPWLGPHRLPQWDVLVAYRLDRLSRRVIPLNRLFGFLQDHDKTLASVSESLDLSHWMGRLVANVIAGVAEGELEAISERNRGSQRKVRELGRWHGGTPPYGYTTIQRDYGWYLIPDPAEVRVLREEILPRVLRRQSTNSIAAALNEVGVATRKGRLWSSQVIRTILRGRALLGQHEHNGRLMTDDDGLPVRRAEPILSAAEFSSVQDALGVRTMRSGERNGNMLGGILFCYRCEAPMYYQQMSNRPYDYYRCSNRKGGCTARQIRADLAHDLVRERFLADVGDVERQVRVYVAGIEHAEDLANVRLAIETARREKDLGFYDGDDSGYFERMGRLTDRCRELEDLSSTEAGFQWKGLGETYAQAWDRMDAAERRMLLTESNITVFAASGVGNQLMGRLRFPEDVQAQLGQGNPSKRTKAPSQTNLGPRGDLPVLL
jgi:DNA invertase Pin-like site-specific DNA recombinase